MCVRVIFVLSCPVLSYLFVCMCKFVCVCMFCFFHVSSCFLRVCVKCCVCVCVCVCVLRCEVEVRGKEGEQDGSRLGWERDEVGNRG